MLVVFVKVTCVLCPVSAGVSAWLGAATLWLIIHMKTETRLHMEEEACMLTNTVAFIRFLTNIQL